MPGRIVVLNGGSSSGKTTLAVALQSAMDEPYLHMDSDVFRTFVPARFQVMVPIPELARGLNMRLIAGFHRSVAACARSGNHVIVDHTLYPREWLEDCVDALVDLEPLFVAVRCPVALAKRREQRRGDRLPGLAAFSAERAHEHGTYDLEVDTSRARPAACAARIKAALVEDKAPQAFRRLVEARSRAAPVGDR